MISMVKIHTELIHQDQIIKGLQKRKDQSTLIVTYIITPKNVKAIFTKMFSYQNKDPLAEVISNKKTHLLTNKKALTPQACLRQNT